MSEIMDQDRRAKAREARARKILMNAEERLKKLTGVEKKSAVTIDDFKPLKNCDYNADSLAQNNHFSDAFSRSLEQPTTSSFSPGITPVKNERIVATKSYENYKIYALLATAFLANLMMIFSRIISDEIDTNIALCNMIFVPLILLKLTEYLFKLNDNVPAPSLSMLKMVFINYIKSDSLKRSINYFKHISDFIQDLCVYFFLFILMYKILNLNEI